MTAQKGKCSVCKTTQRIEYGVIVYHEAIVTKGKHNTGFRQCDGAGKKPKAKK